VEWREAAPDAAAEGGDAAPLAPFSLDFAQRARATALAAVSNLCASLLALDLSPLPATDFNIHR
jgi:hypothetical protein